VDPGELIPAEESQKLLPALGAKAVGALLGSAVGDALGWPQERASSKRQPKTHSSSFGQFVEWNRVVGGQYLGHTERIRRGEYSDDTQLIIATARSLLRSQRWWRDLAQRELAVWTLIERGGGGATKRAASSWVAGKPPWAQARDADLSRYFDAGGNGVAMRVLPHCVIAAADGSFERLGHDILANGVLTHGHPRALLGGLLFGFVLWRSIRRTDTLDYGGLIDEAIAASDEWAQLPNIDDVWDGWRWRADRVTKGYVQHWQSTRNEMLELLRAAKSGMEHGALAVDREVLQEMRCFDRTVNGSGTITAVASVFLASRYAPDPTLGLLEAAYALGADTDTLASMTAGLLGILNGPDWLSAYSFELQDAAYLRELAMQLATRPAPSEGGEFVSVTRASIDETKQQLKHATVGQSVVMPDGVSARLDERTVEPTRSRDTEVQLQRLTSQYGQTLYIRIFEKVQASKSAIAEARKDPSESVGVERFTPEVVRIGLRIPVRQLSVSREFYANQLALTTIREDDDVVRFEGGLSISQSELRVPLNMPLQLSIETRDVDRFYERALSRGVAMRRALSPNRGGRSFQCVDPDGNIVEIFERDAEGPPVSPAETVAIDDQPIQPTRSRPRRNTRSKGKKQDEAASSTTVGTPPQGLPWNDSSNGPDRHT
jgi:ADP-ribosylglycohydrolase/predicted enzyme related to lactoylglutathione lyase